MISVGTSKSCKLVQIKNDPVETADHLSTDGDVFTHKLTRAITLPRFILDIEKIYI